MIVWKTFHEVSTNMFTFVKCVFPYYVLQFLQKPDNLTESFLPINISICLCRILSKTLDIGDSKLIGLQFSLSRGLVSFVNREKNITQLPSFTFKPC